MDEVNFRFLGPFSGCRGDLGSWSAPASDPESDSHDGEVDSYEHGAGEVGADAYESVGLHEQVEEEALVEMLEKIVQASEGTFDASSHGHFILPAFSYRLQSNGVNMVRDEAAVWAGRMAEALANHTA